MSLSPLLVKQDFYAAPALPKLIAEANACVPTYFKEWTGSKQFFCYDNQVAKRMPGQQCHGLPLTHPELHCTCLWVLVQEFQLCKNRWRDVRPWTHSGHNRPSGAAEAPSQAAILPRRKPVRKSFLCQDHRTTGHVRQGWWLMKQLTNINPEFCHSMNVLFINYYIPQ